MNALEILLFPTVISFDLPLVLVIVPILSRSDFLRLCLGESKSRADGPLLGVISIPSSMVRFVWLGDEDVGARRNYRDGVSGKKSFFALR